MIKNVSKRVKEIIEKDLPIEKEQIKKYLTKLNKSKISELTYGEANELLKKAEGSIRAEIAWYEQEVEG